MYYLCARGGRSFSLTFPNRPFPNLGDPTNAGARTPSSSWACSALPACNCGPPQRPWPLHSPCWRAFWLLHCR